MSPLLSMAKVSFSWPGGKQVLKDLDLRIEKTDAVALFGPNGSGKSTLTKLIMGLLKPSAGAVLLAGRPLESYSLSARSRQLGYVMQNPEGQFFAPSVAQEIGFPLQFRGLPPEVVAERVREMLALFQLEAHAGSFPFHLSQGEKQRLALAAIMANEPEFLILDEPFAGLDWLQRQQLLEILAMTRAKGVGCLIISHDRALCSRLCNRVLTLEGGRLG